MKTNRGFSLIEVLIGTCVLLFILFPAFLVMSQSLKMLSCARMNSEASARMQSLVEDFRAMNYTDIQGQYFTGRSQPFDLSGLLSSEGFNSTRYFASVQLSQQNSRTDFLYADFSITWADAYGHIQTRVYHTRFGQNGLSDQILKGF